MGMTELVAWAVLLGAAVLEVGGDAFIRKGLRGGAIAFLLAGCAVLGSYGILVNTLRWDFSRMLGVYVAFFALVSILAGMLLFGERIPNSTWIGLALILAGGMVIQFGKG
jgi:small multidrug resistance family-3 protein